MPNVPFSLQGVPSNYPLPSVFVQINYAQGLAGGAAPTYVPVLLGNKTAAGSATEDTVLYGPDTFTSLGSEADAINLFGQGSELHRMYRRWVRVNPFNAPYAVSVAKSSGVDGYINITLTASSPSNGTVRYYFTANEVVDTQVLSTDTATTLAARVASNINSQVNWPITASNNSSAVLTVTAKEPGLRGNELRGSLQVLNGTGVTSSVTTQTLFSNGTVSDSNTNALSTLETSGLRFYYMVSAAHDEDTGTQFKALASQVATDALPANGKRQRCFCASSASAATVNTLANGVNLARAEIQWLPHSDLPPAEIATIAAAAYSVVEAFPLTAASCNVNGLGGNTNTSALWNIPAPLDGTFPTATQQVTALNNGVSPIQVLKGGRTSLVRRVTTYTLNGSNPDYRIRDAFKVTILDYLADEFALGAGNQFGNYLISDDPAPNQPDIPNVLSPRLMKTFSSALLQRYANNGLIQNLSQTLASLVAQRGNPARDQMQVIFNIYTADQANSIGLIVNQLS